MKEPFEQYKPAVKLELEELQNEASKVFKKISCPSCAGEVSADNLNLEKSLAKCGSCHALFSIEEEVEALKNKKEVKQKYLRPEGIDLFYYKDDLDITLPQHIHWVDVMGMVFAPPLALLTIFIFFAESISVLIPIGFLLVAIYYIYKAFRYSSYKTYIDVSHRFLHIKSRPKNLNKDRTYAVNEIEQLYVSINPSGYYDIHIIVNGLEGQKHEKLVTVKTLSKAKFLEQEIEHYLGIVDRVVPEANI